LTEEIGNFRTHTVKRGCERVYEKQRPAPMRGKAKVKAFCVGLSCTSGMCYSSGET